MPGIVYLTTHLTLDCDPPTPIQADGELFDRTATHAEYGITPGKLRVITPRPERQARHPYRGRF